LEVRKGNPRMKEYQDGEPSEWIEGKYLVLPDWTALPRRCVKTNRAVNDGEYRTVVLPWLPKWLKIVMCLSPFFCCSRRISCGIVVICRLESRGRFGTATCCESCWLA